MIFHIATAADWRAARRSGSYTTSTRGRTLAQEGFVHCSRSDQWPAVRERWYADATEPLVLLVVDPEKLSSPVVEEAAEPGGETHPHVYGPIEVDAVVRATPLDQALADLDRSFGSLFVGEMVRRVVLATVVMLLAVVGAVVGGVLGSGDGSGDLEVTQVATDGDRGGAGERDEVSDAHRATVAHRMDDRFVPK